MKKILVFALSMIAMAPLFGQGVVKKVEDKTKDAAQATGRAAEKAADKTKETAKDAADATADGTKKVAEKTKDAAQDAGKATKDTARKVADSKPAQATADAAKTVGEKTASAGEKVGKEVKKAVVGPPSASDIADAQAKGRVWVNTESGVYHTSGQFYGKTKEGKFMTKAAADKAGFHAAQ